LDPDQSEVTCRLQQVAALIQRESNLGRVREALSLVWNRKENASNGEPRHSGETCERHTTKHLTGDVENA
jgi:hypothetical protein